MICANTKKIKKTRSDSSVTVRDIRNAAVMGWSVNSPSHTSLPSHSIPIKTTANQPPHSNMTHSVCSPPPFLATTCRNHFLLPLDPVGHLSPDHFGHFGPRPRSGLSLLSRIASAGDRGGCHLFAEHLGSEIGDIRGGRSNAARIIVIVSNVDVVFKEPHLDSIW